MGTLLGSPSGRVTPSSVQFTQLLLPKGCYDRGTSNTHGVQKMIHEGGRKRESSDLGSSIQLTQLIAMDRPHLHDNINPSPLKVIYASSPHYTLWQWALQVNGALSKVPPTFVCSESTTEQLHHVTSSSKVTGEGKAHLLSIFCTQWEFYGPLL